MIMCSCGAVKDGWIKVISAEDVTTWPEIRTINQATRKEDTILIHCLGGFCVQDRQTGGCSWSVNAKSEKKRNGQRCHRIASTRKAAINGAGVLFLLPVIERCAELGFLDG